MKLTLPIIGSRPTTSDGFSLLELLVVLAIGLALSYSATFSFKSRFVGISARRSAEDLVNLLNTYAAAALSSGQPLTLVFEEGTNRIYLRSSAYGLHRERLLYQTPDKVLITDVSFGTLKEGRRVLVLKPESSATPGRIVLGDERNSCSITQSIRGARSLKCER